MYTEARVELYLLEPLSWEKMLVRTIPVKSSFIGTYSYRFNTKDGQTFVGEDKRPEAYGEVLAKLYNEIFTQFQKYFEQMEISAIAEKAKEVRGRRRY